MEWKFLPYKADGVALEFDYFSFKINAMEYWRVIDRKLVEDIVDYLGQFNIENHANITTKVESQSEFQGNLFMPDSLYSKCFDAVFVDPNQQTIFMIKITSDISSHKPLDKIFFEVLEKSNNKF